MNKQRLLWITAVCGAMGVLLAGMIWGLGWETAVFATTPADHLPEGSFAARVYYEDKSQISQLEAAGVDLWEYNNLEEQYVLVGTDAWGFAQLEAAGWRVSVDALASAQLRPPAALFSTAAQRSETFYGGYRTVADVVALLNKHNADYPQLVELFDYGDAYCKGTGDCETLGGETIPDHDLLALRISNEAIAGGSEISGSTVILGSKPVFFLIASIHPRELPTPEVALFFIDWLLDGYGVDAQATWLVDQHEIWVVPIANPDGHWLVELGEKPPYNRVPFSQRKNANLYGNGTNGSHCGFWPPSSGGQYGVDLNRNHSFAWGGAGTNSSYCHLNYLGRAAASEPEVAQLEALVRAVIPDQRGDALTDAAPLDTTGIFITMHSYSDLVLWPWGHTGDAAPNREGLKAIGDELGRLTGYRSCQPADCLYAASGTSDDFAYGELGVPAFTFEIGSFSDGFFPPYSTVVNEHWGENRPALRYAATIAHAPYEAVRGPKVVSATAVSGGGVMTVTAVFADSDPIAGATLAINASSYSDGAQTFAMQPVDGAFDGGVETAVVTLTADQLTGLERFLGDSRQLLLLSAEDDAGHEGVIEAIWGEMTLGPPPPPPPVEEYFLFMPLVVVGG